MFSQHYFELDVIGVMQLRPKQEKYHQQVHFFTRAHFELYLMP